MPTIQSSQPAGRDNIPEPVVSVGNPTPPEDLAPASAFQNVPIYFRVRSRYDLNERILAGPIARAPGGRSGRGGNGKSALVTIVDFGHVIPTEKLAHFSIHLSRLNGGTWVSVFLLRVRSSRCTRGRI